MIVKAIWEFDFDTEDLDPEFIDIPGLAKEMTRRELDYILERNELCGDDFEYVVEES